MSAENNSLEILRTYFGREGDNGVRPLDQIIFLRQETLSNDKLVEVASVYVKPCVQSAGYYTDFTEPHSCGEETRLVDRVEARYKSFTSTDPLIKQGMMLDFENYPPLGSNNPEDYRNMAETALAMLIAAAEIRFGKAQPAA